mgnify:FL=1
MRKTLYYGFVLLLCSVMLASAMPAMATDLEVSVPMEEDSQQDKKRIVGQVIDENGYPLPGATALIKGRPNGAITDNEGRFELNVSERDVLVVSYLGYIEQEVDVRGKTSLTIKMEPLGDYDLTLEEKPED